VNGVAKPCAGERHARFERGPLGRSKPGEMEHAPNGETLGNEPIRRTVHTEPVAYLTLREPGGEIPPGYLPGTR
jgi:hypothetical protein